MCRPAQWGVQQRARSCHEGGSFRKIDKNVPQRPPGPDLWVHGHTHNSFDYMFGKTRVVVNPYGYKDVEVNPQFDKSLVIKLCSSILSVFELH
jgi:hypothetical protein